MIYKEDWEKTKERFHAFWSGDIIDRCCFAITAPRGRPVDSKYEHRETRDLVQKWIDSEFRLEQTLYGFSHTYFGGDAFPL
jgi:hypothetical protein